MTGHHPSHRLRFSWDASTFDYICEKCRCTDQVPGGWGLLKEPCPAKTEPRGQTDENQAQAKHG